MVAPVKSGEKWTIFRDGGPAKVDGPSKSQQSLVKLDGHFYKSGANRLLGVKSPKMAFHLTKTANLGLDHPLWPKGPSILDWTLSLVFLIILPVLLPVLLPDILLKFSFHKLSIWSYWNFLILDKSLNIQKNFVKVTFSVVFIESGDKSVNVRNNWRPMVTDGNFTTDCRIGHYCIWNFIWNCITTIAALNKLLHSRSSEVTWENAGR